MPLPLRAICRHKFRSFAFVVIALFTLLNLIAFMQARAMTHFSRSRDRTAAPEKLGLIQKCGILVTGVSVPRPFNTVDPSTINLAYSTYSIASTDQITLEAWWIPADDSRGAVVLLPSYASAKADWLTVAHELHDLHQDVLLIDFRGCGGSTGDVTTIGYREADDATAAVRFVRTKFHPARVTLMGESMGAAAAIRAQSLESDLADALIVEAPFDRLLSTVENRFHAMGLPAFPNAQLVLFWGGLQLGYDAFAYNPADDAMRITCPVLHLHGQLDPRVTNQQADNLFSHFAGSKTFVEFEHAGHGGDLASDRPRWIEAVRSFLEGTTAKGAKPYGLP